MGTDLARAVETLARATEQLAGRDAARGPETTMLWVTGGLLLANLLLVGVTYWYARLTRASARAAEEAARAAERSAAASEAMVGFERERLLAAERPKLVISAGDTEEHFHTTNIVNTGPGPAREATLFVYVEHPEARDPVKAVQLPYEIPGGAVEKPTVYISQAHYLQAAIRIRLCHYTDRHSSLHSPRVYHSIYIEERDTPPQQRSFTPESPIEADPDFARYLRLCGACSGKSE